uniref:Uncharacterized protein n=1 Tax=Meloidogyne enterolobii TaxID=390850 RepID=A0A6V7WAW3_MELEN|nr:unnamed protein product [Meloidogyne enterolobii]
MFYYLFILLLNFTLNIEVFPQMVTIELFNNCSEPIWPAIKNDGPIPNNGGFGPLQAGQVQSLSVPSDWKSARIWPRTGCGENMICITGSCGNGVLECNGLEGQIPASLAEFTLNGDGGLSYYDVSYVDGSNIPLQIIPIAGTFNGAVGNCKEISCTEDQRNLDLQKYNIEMKDNNAKIVAIRSLCSQYNTDATCCKNAYNDGNKCRNGWNAAQNDIYTKIKTVCPTSYLYAYDDHTSLFTCKGVDGRISPDFKVVFCGLK